MPMIKAVFLAGVDVADCFLKYAGKYAISLAAVYDGSSVAHAADTASLPDAVIVVDTVTVPAATVDRFTESIDPHRGYIAIVPEIKKGFAYLNRGASDMLVKPGPLTPHNSESFAHSLCIKIKMSDKKGSASSDRELKYSGPGVSDKIIAIGSSTGGTEAVLDIIRSFPENCPPVLVAQHMPPVFTKLYAQRLHGLCRMSVWEAKDGDALCPGLALIAPGDHQMRVRKKNNSYAVETVAGERVNGLAPSVDALFFSLAEAAGSRAVGVILTGMG